MYLHYLHCIYTFYWFLKMIVFVNSCLMEGIFQWTTISVNLLLYVFSHISTYFSTVILRWENMWTLLIPNLCSKKVFNRDVKNLWTQLLKNCWLQLKYSGFYLCWYQFLVLSLFFRMIFQLPLQFSGQQVTDISGHHFAWNRLVLQTGGGMMTCWIMLKTVWILEIEELSFAVNTL